MKQSMLFLLLTGVLVSLAGVPAEHLTSPSTACTMINAYDESGYVCAGIFVRIDTVLSSADTIACLGETFHTRYRVILGSTCGASDGGCMGPSTQATIRGNNLSGTYSVETANGRCLKLCPCTAP